MKKIKVCYVISSLSNQGPPNVLYNIIQYMKFERFEGKRSIFRVGKPI